MRKIMIICLLCFMVNDVKANEYYPRYKIVAHSNNKNDIKYMYEVKNNLIKDYSLWVKGVDNKKQVLLDHLDEYNALMENNEYVIYIGEGNGRCIKGELKTNYCQSVKEIKKRSFIWDWFF